MWGNSQRYYRPYSSDDESDSDQSDVSLSSGSSSGTDSSLESSKSIESVDSNLQNQIVGPNFKQFALNLQRTAGPSFSTIKQQVEYGVDKLTSKVPYSYYEATQEPPDQNLLSNYGGPKYAADSKQLTSVVIIDSTYRDYSVYPQPTLLTLRLPRVYKNIVNIQMVQIKLLSSFYYFSPTKNNISMTIQEIGRFVKGTSNLHKFEITIKQGTYDINSLLTQLNNEINQTPLFYYYNNFFDDFNIKFQTSGSYALNFNEAGDAYYDPVTQLFIPNPTKPFIVSKFWKYPTGGQTAYTTIQAKVAYYYPPLKWAIINNDYSFLDFSHSLNILPSVTSISNIVTYIYNGFVGLDDPLVASIINANVLPNDSKNRLENYRTSNTFANYPINRYIIAVEQQSQKITITSTTLNTSLVTLINNEYNISLANSITQYPTTAQTYILAQTQILQVNCLIQDMYSYLQKNFLTYFAVNYNQYSINYYTNLGWTYLLQNGTNVVGLASNLLSSEQLNIRTNSNDILSAVQQNPPYYWPRYQNTNGITSVSNTVYMENLSNSEFGDLNHPYIMESGEFYLSNYGVNVQAIASNTGYFYSDITETLNCIVPIKASKYTIFKFHSAVRQSIEVETLPRPLKYRIPEYNTLKYSPYIINAFNSTYSFIHYSNMPYSNNTVLSQFSYTTLFDNLNFQYLTQVPGWSSNNINPSQPQPYSWGNSLSNTLDFWQSNNGAPALNINSGGPSVLNPNTTNRAVYFTFTTPNFSNNTANDYSLSNFRYTLSCMVLLGYTSDVTSNYNKPIVLVVPQLFRCFLYHDRAAFQADVLCNRNESPINYIKMMIVDSNTFSNTFSFQTYPNQQYYMIVRPDVYTFGQAYVSVSPYFQTVPPQYDVLTNSINNMNPSTDVFLANFYKNNFQYSKLYDPAYIQLPIQSNIQGRNPDTIITSLNIYQSPLGYDTNGISTDYTDYVPYIGNGLLHPNNNLLVFDPYTSILGIDPINQYLFQKNQPYNILTNTYIYPNQPQPGNTAITPGLHIPYIPSNVPTRQIKICHYYSLTYIADINNITLQNSIINCNAAQQPFLSNITDGLNGYTFMYQPASPDLNYLTLGKGVVGFSFLPDTGIWDVNKVVFRSAISDSNNDPNSNIGFLGVYNMNDIFNFNIDSINLKDAIVQLKFNARQTYLPNNTVELNPDMNGYDSKGGTYYEFTKITSFVPTNTRQIIGTDQNESQLINNPADMYSLIAFDKNSNLTRIQALSGSLIPYPLYNKFATSNRYLDSNFPPDTRFDIIYPYGTNQTYYSFVNNEWANYAPPVGYPTGTQSQFEQSTPIGTSVVHYEAYNNFAIQSNALYAWKSIINPNNIILTIPNYALLQEVNYSIYYFDSTTPSRTFSNLLYTYTQSDIENTYTNQIIAAVSGNSFTYVFLGFTFANVTTYELRFSVLNNITGALNTYEPPVPIYIPAGGSVQEFYFRDTHDFVLSYQRLDGQMSVYWSVNSFTNVYSNIFPNSTKSNLAIALDCRGGSVYWMPLDSNYNSGSRMYRITDIDSEDSSAFTESPTGASYLFTMKNDDRTPILAPFSKFITWWLPNQDADTLFFITNSNFPSNSNIFILTSIDYNVSEMYTKQCIFHASNANNTPLNILSIHSGSPVIGSVNNTPTIFILTGDLPSIWGNLATEFDDPHVLGSAWQIFYPFQKIVLTKLANSSTPITDSNYIDYPEYPHTQLFYYRNSNLMSNDIYNGWGQESSNNFLVANTNFDGYYFNSYIFNVPAIKSSNTDYQYLVVRNYTPTEESQVLMRFYLPGKYNFGYMTLNDLIYEITLINQSETTNFNRLYQDVIINFDTQYNISSNWGNNNLSNYTGSTMAFTSFSSFMTSYINLNNLYNKAQVLINTVNSNTNDAVTNFLRTELSDILPNINTSRQNYTDSYQFNVLWKSALPPQYTNLNTQWGLGWNLGFSKADTPFTTFLRADSFYKILDDYIFMKLNPEYKLNTLDSTNNEDLAITRDTTGQIENYHAKILLASFGNYSYTSIVNPAVLNPPVPRLDQMYFQLVDITGTQLSNIDCEWSATLQIVEETIPSLNTRTMMPK
jgi:hypothetical protein